MWKLSLSYRFRNLWTVCFRFCWIYQKKHHLDFKHESIVLYGLFCFKRYFKMQQLESVFERCRQMLLSEELSEFDALFSEQTWPRTTLLLLLLTTTTTAIIVITTSKLDWLLLSLTKQIVVVLLVTTVRIRGILTTKNKKKKT